MNRFSLLFPILLVLVRPSAWANPPDYLSNGNDSRMIPNTFEAYQLNAEPWNNFRVNFGYVGVLKNLWLRIRYACNAASGQMQTEDFRVILNYTFIF